MNRLEQVNGQFTAQKQYISSETIEIQGKTYPEIVDNHASRGIKLDYWNKYGWGYKDSGFDLDKKEDAIRIKGSRYMFGGQILPGFLPWVRANLGVDTSDEELAQEMMPIDAPIVNHAFLEELGTENISRRSFLAWERIIHSHGATFQEVSAVKTGKFARTADCVVLPLSTENVENLVTLANKHDVVLVPYGGGTNVTWSL